MFFPFQYFLISEISQIVLYPQIIQAALDLILTSFKLNFTKTDVFQNCLFNHHEIDTVTETPFHKKKF